MDDLACENPRGSRHSRRYQDIRELLKAGISVYTTVSAQNIESLNDIVTAITRVPVKDRIPDSVFDHADQVELVDLEPRELLERLRNGGPGREGRGADARNSVFCSGQPDGPERGGLKAVC